MKEEKKQEYPLTDTVAPLYKKLYEEIRIQIITGKYRPGDKLPSEGELCQQYGVSRITVRSALQNLVEEKLLVKYHGKGTFVALPEQVEVMDSGNSFTKSCQRMNAVPSTKVVSITLREAGEWIAEKLRIKAADRIICIKRLRLVDGVPMIWEIDYFRGDHLFLMEADIEHESLLEIVKKGSGVSCSIFEDVFDVSEAGSEAGKYLDCAITFPLLRVSQSVYDKGKGIIYYNEQYIRSDRYKYAVRSTI